VTSIVKISNNDFNSENSKQWWLQYYRSSCPGKSLTRRGSYPKYSSLESIVTSEDASDHLHFNQGILKRLSIFPSFS
jgi:hypothetical protein